MSGQPDRLPPIGVVVGIPSSRLVTPEWAIALAVQAWPSNTSVCYVPIHCGNPQTGTQGPPRDKARELIIESAIKLKAPYVWFVDDDVEVPFGACRQLLRTLKEADPEVCAVGGIYPEKNDPPSPVVYTTNGHGPDWRWKKNTIFEASLIGTGCMMVKTEVFSKMEKPWFRDINEGLVNITDDAYFVMKAKEAGYKVLADAHVICFHWDYKTMRRYEIPADSYPMRDIEAPPGKEWMNDLPVGWMSIPELLWLTEQAAQHKKIVELGSFLGRTTIALARSTPGEVYAIDDFRGVSSVHLTGTGLEKKQIEDIQSNLFAYFRQNTASIPNIKVIQTDHADTGKLPVEWVRGLPEEKPDMVFIDGSHEYEDVKRDIMVWRERLMPGGLLCGHDLDWPGVRQAIDELLPGWKSPAGSIWSAQ